MKAEDTQCSHEQESHALTNQRLTAKEQIEIILHEYMALRQEALAGITGWRNFLALYVLVAGSLVGLIYQTGSVALFFLMPTLFLIFFSMESNRLFNILYLSMYLGLLEERVNKLAGESLLLWDHFGSMYHRLGWKIRIEHPAKTQSVTILHSIIVSIFYTAVAVLFFFTLFQGASWLRATMQTDLQVWRIIMVTSYVLIHLFVSGLVVFHIVAQQRKVLSVVKEELKQKMFPDPGHNQ